MPLNLSGFTKMGMAQSFGITPNPTRVPHWAKNNGVKLKDKIGIFAFESDVDIKFDEFIEDNIVLALFGTAVSSGEISIGTSQDAIERQIAFVGTNTYGPRLEILLPKVSFYSKNLIEAIGDAAWGQLELTGEMLVVGGSYGTITFGDAPSGAPLEPGNTENYYFGMGDVWSAPVS